MRGGLIAASRRLPAPVVERLIHPKLNRQNRSAAVPAKSRMSQAYIIEVSSYTAGLVVRDETGLRFFSCGRAVDLLDGHRFNSVRAAERAANFLVERRGFQKSSR